MNNHLRSHAEGKWFRFVLLTERLLTEQIKGGKERAVPPGRGDFNYIRVRVCRTVCWIFPLSIWLSTNQFVICRNMYEKQFILHLRELDVPPSACWHLSSGSERYSQPPRVAERSINYQKNLFEYEAGKALVVVYMKLNERIGWVSSS